MRRIVGLLPGRQVATGIPAVRRLNIQRVVVVDVALRASRDLPCRGHLVRIRQREARGAVIERRIRPTCGVVTSRALRNREARGDVIRDVSTQSLRAVPLLQVTAGIAAIRGGDLQCVVVIDVALCAGSRDVSARQGKTSHAMVE